MKITDIKTLKLTYPLDEPVITSFGRMDSRTGVLVRIDTDEGISGTGETWTNFPKWAPEERKLTVEKGIKPLLMGENPLRITYLWNKMHNTLMKSGAGLQYGAKGPLFQAMSGVDIALWDIAGKKLNIPVYQLLGGKFKNRVPAYASGLGPKDFEKYVEKSVDLGFTAFKLKVGFGKDMDMNNLKIIRELIGDSNDLMIDANQGWENAEEALDNLECFNKFNVSFIEEPVRADKFNDLKKIKDARIMPVAGGENIYSRYGFKDILTGDILDIVQPDITKTGGISESGIICHMADAWDIPYAPHMFGTAVGIAASLHLLLAIPNGLIMETDANPNPLRTELVKESFYKFEKGFYAVDKEKPGIGIELDEDIMKDITV